MAGASIRIDIDDKAVRRALQSLLTVADNPRSAFLEIGEFLQIAHDERFSEQVSPEGVPWAPLSPDYLARKPKNQNLILILDEHLKGELHYQVTGSGPALALEFGTPLIYGATHQFGAPERNIPERPFLGLSEADERGVLDILNDHLNRALNRR